MSDGEKLHQEISRVGGARPGAGRPAFVPTDEDRANVEKLAGLGLSYEQISALVRDGISVPVLMNCFKRELELGKAKAHSKIGGKLFQKAMDGDTASLIWWTKTQMRWAETQKHEIVQTTISINGALEAAKNRLINSDIIDIQARELEQSEPQVLTSDVDVKKPTESGLGGSEG
jgi:hypothetical protein